VQAVNGGGAVQRSGTCRLCVCNGRREDGETAPERRDARYSRSELFAASATSNSGDCTKLLTASSTVS